MIRQSKIKVNGYSSVTLCAKRKLRRDQADERQVIHDNLSVEEKIRKASFRVGMSKRELKRLIKAKK